VRFRGSARTALAFAVALTLARLAATKGDASAQERDRATRAHEKIVAAL
jgi:hypothetical protein